jgi:hypothetical protein
MADSVLQAGPIVQMILARRMSPFVWVGISSGFSGFASNQILD